MSHHTQTQKQHHWLSRNEKILVLVSALLLILTFFFDQALLRRGVGLRFSWLDGLMLFLTDFGMIYFAVVLIVSFLLQRRYRWLAIAFISLALSFEISYLLKLIFQVPRPYFNLELATIPLTQASGYSFPSLHAAICFGAIPFILQIYSGWKRWLAVTIAVIIAYSRAYLGVHYFSDIIAGSMIGYLFSRAMIYLEARYNLIVWFLGHVKSKLELRRQIAHLLIGMSIVFLMELKLMTPNILIFTLLLGAIISIIYRYRPIPLIHEILVALERPKDIASFPGRGPFFLILGSLMAMLLFPADIAKGAITVLAVGDSISHIVGRYFGRTRVPFSKDKMLEGTVVAIVLSTFTALLFVDFTKAFLASLITITCEAVYPEKAARYLDDNLIIPIVAGAIMLILS